MSGKVPPSSRANVRAKPSDDEIVAGKKLRESFTGYRTKIGGSIDVSPLPKAVVVIGPCDFIGYTVQRDGKTEKYIHHFASKDKPAFCVSPDGKQILLIGGDYDFTERGIVDGSDTKTRRELGLD
jgi:hypothetical protein